MLGVSLFSYYMRKRNKVNIYYVDRLPRNYNGMIVPAVGIFITEKEKDNQELLNHELIHWKQYQEEGLLMLPKYLSEILKNGYDGNTYEVEARENESEYCKYNYTECVRTGKSVTAYNPNFRR